MDLTPIGAVSGVIEGAEKLASDLITTDKDRMAAVLADKQEDDKLLLGQQDTNRVEAASGSLFVAGGRPFIVWVCGVALACAYIPKCAVMALAWIYQAWVMLSQWRGVGAMPNLPTYPELGVMDLIGLVSSMLGISTIRHREVMAGKARSSLADKAIPDAEPTSAADQEAP